MIHKLKQIRLWQTILSFIIFIIAILFLLPAMDAACGGIITPDSDFWYTSSRLEEIKNEYTRENVSTYVSTRFTHDLLWPLIYGFFLLSSIVSLSKPIQNKPLLTSLYLMPILTVLFDYLENISCSMFFSNVLSQINNELAPIASSLKWISILICFTILIILTIYRLTFFFSQKSKKD